MYTALQAENTSAHPALLHIYVCTCWTGFDAASALLAVRHLSCAYKPQTISSCRMCCVWFFACTSACVMHDCNCGENNITFIVLLC